MTLRVAFLIVLFTLSVTWISAQERIVVPLRFNPEVQQFSGLIITERMNDAPIAYTTPAADGVAHAPEKVLFQFPPVAGSPNTYNLFIDAHNDGDVLNDTKQTLVPR